MMTGVTIRDKYGCHILVSRLCNTCQGQNKQQGGKATQEQRFHVREFKENRR